MNPKHTFHHGLLDAIASYDVPVADALLACERVASRAAELYRTGRLSRRAARTLLGQARATLAKRALETGRPRLDRRCDDCAFRPDSPERTQRPEEMAAILRDLDAALEGRAPFVPFFCHRSMPVDDAARYTPAMRRDGSPVGAPLCSGWVEEMDRRRAVADRGAGSGLRAEQPDLGDERTERYAAGQGKANLSDTMVRGAR